MREAVKKVFRGALLLGLFFSFCAPYEIDAGQPDPSSRAAKDLLQVEVRSVGLDANGQPVVLLADRKGGRAMPVWIGPCEAEALQLELQGMKAPRPLTHDLLKIMTEKLGGKVRRIAVTHQKDRVYYARIFLDKGGAPLEIDARPSDALVLALKVNAPVFVSKTLFQEMSIPLGEPQEKAEGYGLFFQELTPQLAESFSFPSTRGALVADIREGSRAEKDGWQRGDILVEAGGEPVAGVQAAQKVLERAQKGLPARVFRQGKFVVLTLHAP